MILEDGGYRRVLGDRVARTDPPAGLRDTSVLHIDGILCDCRDHIPFDMSNPPFEADISTVYQSAAFEKLTVAGDRQADLSMKGSENCETFEGAPRSAITWDVDRSPRRGRKDYVRAQPRELS